MTRLQMSTLLVAIIWATVAIMWKMEQRVDIHWMIPKHAKCAVKMMYFRVPSVDGKTDLIPQNRMVCNWDNDFKQPEEIPFKIPQFED